MEINGLQEKTWGFQLVFLPVPPPFASCHQVGIPGESFWASQMMGICHEMMGHPKRFLCKKEIVQCHDPKYLYYISSFTTVSTILWQTPQKIKIKKSWVWPSPYTTNHIYQPSITFTLHLGNQASGSPPCAGQSWPWWYLWIPEIISMTWVSWLSFGGEAIDLQFLSSSPVSAPRTSGRPFCAVPHNHSPSTSKIHKRSPRLCFMRGWLAPWNLPFQWRHTYMLCVCIYERIDGYGCGCGCASAYSYSEMLNIWIVQKHSKTPYHESVMLPCCLKKEIKLVVSLLPVL